MLGHRRFSEIRSVDIGQLVAALERKGLSAQSRMHVYNTLHKMFEDAVEFYEFVDRNPVKRRFRPTIHRIEREFLSPADSWKLLDEARKHPEVQNSPPDCFGITSSAISHLPWRG